MGAAGTYDPEELLRWYVDAGIDVALGDEPVDHFAAPAVEASRTGASIAPAERKPAPAARHAEVSRKEAAVPTADVVARAHRLAQAASDLAGLRAVMEDFDGCNLRHTAQNLVFGDGDRDARIMVIGEAPDRAEDEQGLPFVGRSGQLFDRMLASIGLDRKRIYLANVVPWRPPGNRQPTPAEIAICKPFIDRHIELVEPRLLLLMGGSSAKTILDSAKGILSLRGRFASAKAGNLTVQAMPMLHPGYLLKQPAHKRHAWHDLLKVAQWLDENGPPSESD